MKTYLIIIIIALSCFVPSLILAVRKEMNTQLKEENIKIAKQYINEAWNNGRIEILDEIFDSSYVNHSIGNPAQDKGTQGVKDIIGLLRGAFPDLKFEIRNIFSNDDFVFIHSTMTGTHKGSLFGIKPTGNKVTVNQMQVEKIKNGKIIEHWRQSDDLGMLKQLGQIK